MCNVAGVVLASAGNVFLRTHVCVHFLRDTTTAIEIPVVTSHRFGNLIQNIH